MKPHVQEYPCDCHSGGVCWIVRGLPGTPLSYPTEGEALAARYGRKPTSKSPTPAWTEEQLDAIEGALTLVLGETMTPALAARVVDHLVVHAQGGQVPPCTERLCGRKLASIDKP